MRHEASRTRGLRELLTLIGQFEAGWEIYVSRGLLNSEGRKVCVRIGTLAGHLFPGTPYRVRWVMGDASDAHVMSALNTLKQRALEELGEP
jgi:hypothetical protein